jgi:outer membrane biogenesis lipoprotein LolB
VKVLAATAVALLAAACATVPPPVVPLDGLPPSFEMAGRMSVTQEGRGDIFRVRWARSPSSDTWTVSSPVGAEVARIERGPEGITVHRQGEVPVTAASFADLTGNLLGAAIDERLLVAWLHARPAGGPQGWAVTIDESRRIDGEEVARRITAVREGVTVKLVVDEYWTGQGRP